MTIPIPDRYDMAHYAQTHFSETGIAVEVGVFEGEFSAHNLNVWMGGYVMVDTWEHRPDDEARGLDDKNDKPAELWAQRMEAARRNTEFAYNRRVLQKGYSVEVSGLYEDGAFDWIFLDAGHDFGNCLADLEAWWPKLRKGGLFSGDDYGLHLQDDRLLPLTPTRWAGKYGSVAESYKWGTAQALQVFCEKHGAYLNITWLNDRHNPAFYIVK